MWLKKTYWRKLDKQSSTKETSKQIRMKNVNLTSPEKKKTCLNQISELWYTNVLFNKRWKYFTQRPEKSSKYEKTYVLRRSKKPRIEDCVV